MQPTGKPRHQLHMLQKPSPAVSTVACSIDEYDNDISNESSSHAPETDTADKEAECARYHDGSAAHIQSWMYCVHESQSVSTNAAKVTSDEEKIFPKLLSDSDCNSVTQSEQGYQRIFTESDIHK